AVIAILFVGVQLSHAEPTEDEDTGYGKHLIIPDAAAYGMLLTAAFLPPDRVLEASLATYALGGPIVHCVHARYGRAAASLGVRIALPMLGGMLGDGIQQLGKPGVHPWNFDGPPSPWWIIGGVGGLIGASIVDGLWIAGGYHPKEKALTWTPTAHATAGGLA